MTGPQCTDSNNGASESLTAHGQGPEYGIRSIDTKAGKPDWGSVPTLSIGNVLWTEDTGIRAHAQLCHDLENLYVHMSAAEKVIRAENTQPLSPVHEDSCLEFFFRPKGAVCYFNFEINPNGCSCIQFGAERADRFYLVRKDAAEYFDIKTDRTPDGWEVCYRIPLGFMRMFYPDFQFKGVLEANLYKCGDKTPNVHYLSWNRIDKATPDFHCPEFFSRMYFE